MKCDNCGTEFLPGNRPDGLPRGIGFETENGIITYCADCLIKIGREVEEDDGK